MSFPSLDAETWRFGRRSVVAAARALEADLTHAQFSASLST